jgi:hypothetical protein
MGYNLRPGNRHPERTYAGSLQCLQALEFRRTDKQHSPDWHAKNALALRLHSRVYFGGLPGWHGNAFS